MNISQTHLILPQCTKCKEFQYKSHRGMRGEEHCWHCWRRSKLDFLLGITRKFDGGKNIHQTLLASPEWVKVKELKYKSLCSLKRRRALLALSTKTKSWFLRGFKNTFEGGMNMVQTRLTTPKCPKFTKLQYISNCSMLGKEHCWHLRQGQNFHFCKEW